MSSTKIRPIRCPKCRSIDILLLEHISCGAWWGPGDLTGYNIEGSYYKVTGDCQSCGHLWTLKGYIQMDDSLKARLDENYRMLQKTKDQPEGRVE